MTSSRGPTRIPTQRGMAEAGDDLVGGEAQQHSSSERQEHALGDHEPERADRNRGQADGESMTESDRTQGVDDGA